MEVIAHSSGSNPHYPNWFDPELITSHASVRKSEWNPPQLTSITSHSSSTSKVVTLVGRMTLPLPSRASCPNSLLPQEYTDDFSSCLVTATVKSLPQETRSIRCVFNDSTKHGEPVRLAGSFTTPNYPQVFSPIIYRWPCPVTRAEWDLPHESCSIKMLKEQERGIRTT